MLSSCNGRISRLDFSYVPQWVCWEKSSPETMVFTMKKHWFLPLKKWGFPVMFPYRTIEFPLTSARGFPITWQPWANMTEIQWFSQIPRWNIKRFRGFHGFNNWLVVSTPLENDGVRQIGSSSELFGKKNVPNHQPDKFWSIPTWIS